MIILFDPEKLIVNVQGGALDKYAPSEEVKKIVKKTDKLKKLVKEKQEHFLNSYQEFLKTEVDPIREEIKKQILDINKRDVPGFKELTEQEK